MTASTTACLEHHRPHQEEIIFGRVYFTGLIIAQLLQNSCRLANVGGCSKISFWRFVPQPFLSVCSSACLALLVLFFLRHLSHRPLSRIFQIIFFATATCCQQDSAFIINLNGMALSSSNNRPLTAVFSCAEFLLIFKPVIYSAVRPVASRQWHHRRQTLMDPFRQLACLLPTRSKRMASRRMYQHRLFARYQSHRNNRFTACS